MYLTPEEYDNITRENRKTHERLSKIESDKKKRNVHQSKKHYLQIRNKKRNT